MTAVTDILKELDWRGLIHQCTDRATLQELLKTSQVVYAGFDPTSDSLHVGSLLPLMMLRRFQKAGHRPIAVVGGATGMVGDPSGKSDERNLLSKEVLEANVAGLEQQMRGFLDFDGPSGAKLVNNYDWTKGISFLDFLRDIGKNVPVNVMLTKDSVKSRLERQDSGLSYTEFSYMLLQAFDFAYLAKTHQCSLQIGGSDQWGNITAGIDLGRRMHGKALYGLTCPLLLTSDGRKMGKTERGAVYLSASKTSPFAFYQYFVNVEDVDVMMVLRYLTEIEQEEILELEKATKEAPHERRAQKRLAESLTELVHGKAGLDAAKRATDTLFGAAIEDLNDAQLMDIFADVPSKTLQRQRLEEGLSIVDALVESELAKSKGEGRRLVEGGGIYLNNRKIEGIDRVLSASDLASETVMVLRSGKRKYALLKFS
ncbi:MAG: tyrosine--tRNA ligase [Pirellulales bacterium]